MIMPETNVEGALIPVQRLRRMVEEYDFEYTDTIGTFNFCNTLAT